MLSSLDSHAISKNVLLTALLWLVAFGARAVLIRSLRSRRLSIDEQRRFVAASRNAVLVVLMVGTAALWIDELKVFALSVVAVAAAIVVATKELIMCVGGTFLRTSSRSFDVGDRIEVNGLRGDVIDTTLFTTTLLEIGPGNIGHQRTGRALTVPNSVFLTSAVVNESFTETYVLHTFKVVVANDAHWQVAEQTLLTAAATAMLPYAHEAGAFFTRMSNDRQIEIPTQEPRVLVEVASPHAIHLYCRLPAPARTKGRVEQQIVRELLKVTTLRAPPPAPAA